MSDMIAPGSSLVVATPNWDDRWNAKSARPQSRHVARLAGRLARGLSRPPRVALIGEFNTGKSTLANALLGVRVLPTNVEANTGLPILVRYAPRARLELEFLDGTKRPISWFDHERVKFDNAKLLHLWMPLERLKAFELIDTPGLASGNLEVDQRALAAGRTAHVAIWCTSATQAWKASEHRVWQSLPGRMRSRSLLAVTFKDVLDSPRDEGKLEARLRVEAAPHCSRVTLVSAEDAARAQLATRAADRELWSASGGDELMNGVQALVTQVVWQRLASAERLLQGLMPRIAEEPEPAFTLLPDEETYVGEADAPPPQRMVGGAVSA